MGVTGLWKILHPCARPTKLETLHRKRLAVDASIWIYQFLKAVRDKEGNALRNSHVVGFFRRICKLLFFGIKPVFIFDGGAPALKRQTVTERKKRREGRREDAVRTAGKLLALQMQRRAEEEEQKRKEQNRRAAQEDEEIVPDDALVYVDEIGMSQRERQQSRKFKKKDAYHLPDLDVSMNEMGGPNDPRIMSLEELQAYAKQFEAGEDINVYDFSKIDYDSPFFMSLPASDRYNILNAARLRSRLRMGHSKEQLDNMFPDRMAFSKFQIERVRERNELTQRLMHLNETGDALFNGGGRVAGEKGREYVLVKNDGVEGGWALGVISDEGTKRESAIDVDKPAPSAKQDDEWEDEDEFEDVPIEGLNRLPKRPRLEADASGRVSTQRQYRSRNRGRRRKPRKQVDPNSLFVAEEGEGDMSEEWEEAEVDHELFGESNATEEDEDLRRAIAMSLEQDEGGPEVNNVTPPELEDDDMLEVFQQSAAPEARPLPKGTGRAIANIVNQRAFKAAPESREVTSFGVPRPLSPENDANSQEQDEEDTFDFQAALTESRKNRHKTSSPSQKIPPNPVGESSDAVAKNAGFSGPLPFEKLDLGTSLLGRKKMQERTEEAAGGFINPDLAEKEHKKSSEPLPPWFSEDVEKGVQVQKELEREDLKKARELWRQFQFDDRGDSGLLKSAPEVIDLEADDDDPPLKRMEIIELEDEIPEPDTHTSGTADADSQMRDVVEQIIQEPPATTQKHPFNEQLERGSEERLNTTDLEDAGRSSADRNLPPSTTELKERAFKPIEGSDDKKELLEWSESEDERGPPQTSASDKQVPLTESQIDGHRSRSGSADFEDVPMLDQPILTDQTSEFGVSEQNDFGTGPSPGVDADGGIIPDDAELAEFDDFSDPEDEDLLRQLTLEAEEHARFASTLNNKPQAQNAADYEKELRQLRNQQKKDRRDADEVTHVMISECQQLLRLFGLPYITAPMEAEAQCAELVRLGLVDGIVTDDSDCFLFGGTRVYKNMFNQAKFVECYLTSDLEKQFNLTRDKLIQVAHLLGSDYTEGLSGVGPTIALEILGEFATLQDFKDWWTGVQMNTIPKAADAGQPFRQKFRRNAAKLFLPSTFPDVRVDIAYQQPEVDSDPEAFQWGVPDLDALRSFLMATIGWSQDRTDEVLVPVIRDMNRRADEGTQSNITAFFEGGVGIGAAGGRKTAGQVEAFAPHKRVEESSKRMGSALKRLADRAQRSRNPGAQHDVLINEDAVSKTKSNQRAPAKKRKSVADGSSQEDTSAAEAAPQRKKKRRAASKPVNDA